MAKIELDKLTKVYADGTRAVDALDLEIADGEFVVLVGPSGCGKTTALRMIAGLEGITDGEVRIGGQRVNDLPPKDRDVAMVFQNYALYPHMTAYANMGFPLKMRGVSKREIDRQVMTAARILGLSEVLRKKPRTLSGGQRQRVAMGRAIVREPQAFLMDEPLSNLDAKLRVEMRAEIARIQRYLNVTTVYVTHDQVEAMTMGDRVAVLRDGVLQQIDAPTQLYDRPTNLFVAEFIGSPSMNLALSRLVADDGRLAVEFGDRRFQLNETTLAQRPGLSRCEGRDIVIGIRPEDLRDADSTADGADGAFRARVDIREDMGSEVVVHLSVNARPVNTEQVVAVFEDEAVEVMAERARNEGVPFVARLDRETRAREGEPLDLAVDMKRLHFFDPESGAAIYE